MTEPTPIQNQPYNKGIVVQKKKISMAIDIPKIKESLNGVKDYEYDGNMVNVLFSEFGNINP